MPHGPIGIRFNFVGRYSLRTFLPIARPITSLCAFVVAIIFVGFAGCNGYTEVARYESSGGRVEFLVRDPNWCDVARCLKVDIVVDGTPIVTYDLTLLECLKRFNVNDYQLVENDDWVILASVENGHNKNERDAIVVFEKKTGRAFSTEVDAPPGVVSKVALVLAKK